MVEVLKEQSYAGADCCSVRMFCKNDTIEQLRMGVYTIATALALLCRASTVATFVGDIGTRKAIYS